MFRAYVLLWATSHVTWLIGCFVFKLHSAPSCKAACMSELPNSSTRVCAHSSLKESFPWGGDTMSSSCLYHKVMSMQCPCHCFDVSENSQHIWTKVGRPQLDGWRKRRQKKRSPWYMAVLILMLSFVECCCYASIILNIGIIWNKVCCSVMWRTENGRIV